MKQESMQEQLQQLRTKIEQLETAAAKSAPRQKKQSRVARIAIAAAMFLIPVVAFGVTITKPYTFVGGQPISASELNENFDTVYDRVNELGIYKLMAGSTALGDILSASSPKNATIITDKGYTTVIYEAKAGTTLVGFLSSVTYHFASDCSDAPLVPYSNTKSVGTVRQDPSANLYYGTGTNPTTVPGYAYVLYPGCVVNSQAGTQTTADFTTTL
ncbi:MAG: hypothetical protein RIF32_13260, partial [Leptospirales bacterium]